MLIGATRAATTDGIHDAVRAGDISKDQVDDLVTIYSGWPVPVVLI